MHDGKRQQRDRDGDERGTLGRPLDAESREQEPREEAARIADVCAGGREVERQETKESARERRGNQADCRVAKRHRDDEDGGRREKSRAGGNAVRAIEEVESVGESDEPEDGEDR